MKIFTAIWSLLDVRQRRDLVALQLVSLLMALGTVGGIAAILPFFTVLEHPQAVGQHELLQFLRSHFQSERSFLVALGLGLAGAVVLSGAINLLGSAAMTRFSYRVGDALRIALFNDYLRRNYAFHLRNNSSTLASNIIFETGRLTGGILLSGLTLTANAVTAVLIAASVLLVSPWIGVAAIVGLGGCYALIYALARKRLQRDGVRQSRNLALQAKVVNEGFAAVKELLLRQAQGQAVDQFALHSRAISRATAGIIITAQVPRYVLECATVLCLVGAALVLSGGGAMSGNWLAHLTFTGLAIYRLLPALQQAFAALAKIRADSSAFQSIGEDLRQARARAHEVGVIDRLPWRGRPHHEIRCEEVSYRHAHDRPPAVDSVSLQIPALKMVGFIGANGSGKTTLADIIAGLLAPERGRLIVDDIVLDDGNRVAWRSTVAYVSQESVLLDTTLAQNIAFGVDPQRIDQDRLNQAIRLAHLEECVAALPRQTQERLGERGRWLSGGQRQRIAIARALYCDASLLIMDEATSELDITVEQELLDTLQALRGTRTIILIAHRISTVSKCDVIFEFEAGRLVRHGTYEQLLQESSHFRQMAGTGA